MKQEYITEILENLRANEGILKKLEEGKNRLRLRMEEDVPNQTGVIICPVDITVEPDETLYAAIRKSVRTDVMKYTNKLKDVLGISEFDSRLTGDR